MGGTRGITEERSANISNIRWMRHQLPVLSVLALLAAAACGSRGPEDDAAAAASRRRATVRPGIEVLLSDSLHLIAGRRVGLVTNHTGIDREGRSDIDLIADEPSARLVALFAPEHGIRGQTQEGVEVESDVDRRTGVPIYSLYGDTRKPTPAMLDGIDVLLYDIQDIGARYYTYVSTMALAMEAAGESGIPFVVLDRPNPIRGDVVQGDVLEPAFSSFVGMYPEPMRHGMTPGELARMFVGEFGVDVELTVVPLDGWSRTMTFDQTELPWVAPSTNMPSLESALAYPGTCLFEATALSVGRGTDLPFQQVGAPWLDAQALADTLNGYGFAGVRFEATTFVPRDPTDGKFGGQEVRGVRLVEESATFDAPDIAVAMLVEARRLHPERWAWLGTFDRLAGTDRLRSGIDAGEGVDALTAEWSAAIRDFERRRAPYLLYD